MTERKPDELRKWNFLREAGYRDARMDPRVRHVAEALLTASLGRPRLFVVLALALVQDGIAYKLDSDRVGHEDIAGYAPTGSTDRTSFDAYERGVDDCDAKSRLFVALCSAVGLLAELVDVWDQAGDLAHVAARVRVDGRWHHVEPTLRRALVGEEPRQVPTETAGPQRGTWLQ